MGTHRTHDYEKIAKFYASGMSLETMCKRFNVTTPTIYRAIKERGVPLREKQVHKPREKRGASLIQE